MIPIETVQLKPRSWIILLAALPALIMFYVALNNNPGDSTFWIAAIAICLIPLGIFVFRSNSYVLLDNEAILYKTPFQTRSINWKDVTRSYLKMQYTGKSSKRNWHFENITGRGLRFSTGLFSRRSLRTIAEGLVTKCPNAEIEQKVRDMAEGKFPWYIF